MSRRADDPDNLSGRWQLDLSRSTVSPPPQELTITIHHEGQMLHADMAGVANDGSPFVQRFETQTDGSEGSSFLDGTALIGRSYWADRELVIETQFGAPDDLTTFRDHWSIDAGEGLLIMEHRDDPLAGTRSVFTRLSEATPLRR